MSSHDSEAPALRTESLLQLAWPIFLQNASNSAVMLVDFYFFSELSDATAGAIGQVMPVFFMGAFVINVFAGAGISVASQYLGAGQQEKVVPAYMTNLALTTSLGIIYALVLSLLASSIGGWMGMPPVLAAKVEDYLGIIGLFFVFQGPMVAYNAVLSSRGMTHWLMFTSFTVAGVNFVLDPLCVYVFHWGVRGIALASVCGAAVACATVIWLVHVKLKVSFFVEKPLSQMRKMLRVIVRIGIANSLEPFSYTFQQTLLSTFVISMGVTAMAANNYAARLHMFQITFAFSLASASQILAAHWVGAGKTDDVNRLFWRTIRLGTGVALVYALLLWQVAPWALRVFTDDPEILELAQGLLLVSAFLEPGRAVNIIGGFTLKTVGDTRFPVVLGMIFIWGILPIIYGINSVWKLSLFGLWVCFAADEVLRAVINLLRWRSGHWKSMAIVVKT